ncbi:MAG: carbon storage regulator [Pirellulaceae bacterium]
MLVLSRKISEGIVIDGDIRIHVLKIRGKTIRLGIEAPEQISIRRFELEPLASATHLLHEQPRDAGMQPAVIILPKG